MYTGEPVITDEDRDNDGDGYSNRTEAQVGTGANDPCGWNGWPSDLVSSGGSWNALTIEDAASFVAPVRRLGTSPGQGDYSARWDLVPGSSAGAHINVQDLAALFSGPTGYPPMMGGQRAFGQGCPYGP